jgi:uncharacterized protein (DUF952 family)
MSSGDGGALGGPHTLHMLPADRWAAWRDGPLDARYEPEGFATDGFVHCTDGDDEMLATANRHYGADPRAFVVLDLDLAALGAPWRYDEPGSPYPHVYGSLRREAVRGARPIRRDAAGRFVGYGDRREA